MSFVGTYREFTVYYVVSATGPRGYYAEKGDYSLGSSLAYKLGIWSPLARISTLGDMKGIIDRWWQLQPAIIPVEPTPPPYEEPSPPKPGQPLPAYEEPVTPGPSACLIAFLFGATVLKAVFPYLRRFRDAVLPRALVNGYYKLSEFLVPKTVMFNEIN
ncbi:MAG: hypothetical protein OEZ18_00650 [Candidatus Bathyarchaeota archaeon]|nr:hypothetical protein [Candidatus Bathyarchaeota archaeon]